METWMKLGSEFERACCSDIFKYVVEHPEIKKISFFNAMVPDPDNPDKEMPGVKVVDDVYINYQHFFNLDRKEFVDKYWDIVDSADEAKNRAEISKLYDDYRAAFDVKEGLDVINSERDACLNETEKIGNHIVRFSERNGGHVAAIPDT